jgi:hypothetical protein
VEHRPRLRETRIVAMPKSSVGSRSKSAVALAAVAVLALACSRAERNGAPSNGTATSSGPSSSFPSVPEPNHRPFSCTKDADCPSLACGPCTPGELILDEGRTECVVDPCLDAHAVCGPKKLCVVNAEARKNPQIWCPACFNMKFDEAKLCAKNKDDGGVAECSKAIDTEDRKLMVRGLPPGACRRCAVAVLAFGCVRPAPGKRAPSARAGGRWPSVPELRIEHRYLAVLVVSPAAGKTRVIDRAGVRVAGCDADHGAQIGHARLTGAVASPAGDRAGVVERAGVIVARGDLDHGTESGHGDLAEGVVSLAGDRAHVVDRTHVCS